MPPRPPAYTNPAVTASRQARPREVRTARLSGDENRPSSHARGYDRAWGRLRRWFLARNPWCKLCDEKGIAEAAVIADHVLTIEERPDLRLDPTNLQSLCGPCHSSTKQRQDRRRKKALARAKARGEPMPEA